jgi:hypothetical protein
MVNDKWEKDLERSNRSLIELGIRLEWLNKTMEASVRIAGGPAEIRTDHLQNTNLEVYR